MIDWSEFNKMNTEEWMTKVDADLKGKKFAKDFLYNVEDDFQVSPFVTDTLGTTTIGSPQMSNSAVWIEAKSAVEANQEALYHLNHGPEYLIIELVDSEWSYENLFKGIHLDMIGVVLLVSDKIEEYQIKLNNYLKENYGETPTNVVIGSQHQNILSSSTSFKDRLSRCKEMANNAIENEVSIVLLDLKQDFFAQVAELRAMRKIWFNAGKTSSNLKIIAFVDGKKFTNTEVHPLIIFNYLLMSAYLGVCDVVAVKNGNNDQELMRLSLNIQHILKEESGFGHVNDPVAGSYIIESLTKQMVEI